MRHRSLSSSDRSAGWSSSHRTASGGLADKRIKGNTTVIAKVLPHNSNPHDRGHLSSMVKTGAASRQKVSCHGWRRAPGKFRHQALPDNVTALASRSSSLQPGPPRRGRKILSRIGGGRGRSHKNLGPEQGGPRTLSAMADHARALRQNGKRSQRPETAGASLGKKFPRFSTPGGCGFDRACIL